MARSATTVKRKEKHRFFAMGNERNMEERSGSCTKDDSDWPGGATLHAMPTRLELCRKDYVSGKGVQSSSL